MSEAIVSIVVPTCNEHEKTIQCFASLRAYTDVPYELVWVDNGSNVQSYNAILQQASKPGVRCTKIKFKNNTGFVVATNAGIRAASKSSKYIVMLNNDTMVSPKWLTRLLAPFKDPLVGAVGPITQSKISWQESGHLNVRWKLSLPVFRTPTVVKRVPEAIEKYAAVLSSQFSTKYVETHGNPLAFFCVAIPRRVIDQVGLLDEDFGIGLGDDEEYCHRLRRNGYKLILSLGSFVFHWHRTTFKSLRLPIDSIRRKNVKLLKAKTR